jgi:DNA mismatch repair protein MLH1
MSIPQNASIVERIRQIHGSAVANELIEFTSSNSRFGFKASGWTSNANYHVKKTTILLFINHRCVESSNIRKAIEQTYSTFLPKGGHPFMYLSLEIDPQRVDVNVHPTKREVNFLNEDEIIEQICNDIRVKLANVDTSRTFMTQTLLPGARIPTATITPDTSISQAQSTPAAKSTQKPYENNLVRTDAKLRKITTMLPPSITSNMKPTNPGSASSPSKYPSEETYTTSDREPVTCRLITIKELRGTVRDSMHNELTSIFASHTFIGIVDERRRLAAIQGGVKLFLVDYGAVSAEYFYQIGLTDFGNFGAIKLSPPPKLRDLLRIAAESEAERTERDGGEAFDVDQVIDLVEAQLIDRREMLLEYFTITLTESGELVTIPLLMKGYTPSLAKLPRFLLNLGPKVNWTSEKECFDTFLRELADFYVPEQLPPSQGPGASGDGDGDVNVDGSVDGELSERREYIRKIVEENLFPAFAARLVATRALMKGAVLEVANLKGLYRVFERC